MTKGDGYATLKAAGEEKKGWMEIQWNDVRNVLYSRRLK